MDILHLLLNGWPLLKQQLEKCLLLGVDRFVLTSNGLLLVYSYTVLGIGNKKRSP